MENTQNIVLKLRLAEQYAIRISGLKHDRIIWPIYCGLLLIWTVVTLVGAIAAGAVVAIIVEIVLILGLLWLGYMIWKSTTSMIKSLNSKLADLQVEEPVNG